MTAWVVVLSFSYELLHMSFATVLKDSLDIVRVVGEYVTLKKQGGRYVAPCPFHTEKTPSFGVNPQLRIFKCFGCGKGGGVIDFVMEIEGLPFWEACTQLAERFGIPLPKRDFQSDEATRQRAGIYEMHEAAQRIFRAALLGPAGAEARAYLQRRGVSMQLAEEFGLGLADRAGNALARKLQSDGFSSDALVAGGLVLRRDDGSGHFDRFRGRLMFPIHNETGKLIAFAGRALAAEDQPKYLNSPETEIYKKSSVLYNLYRARKAIRQTDRVILVEGYMDVIGLHGAGVPEAVASCGTSLTANQVRALRRHSENVVVNFDPDPAGTSAAARSIQMLLEEGAHIRVLELTGGLDPDEFVNNNGVDAYRAALARAPRYFEWLSTRLRTQFDTRTAEGRVAAFKAILPAIHKINDRLERAAHANEIAGLLGVDASMVLEQFRKMAVNRTQAPAAHAKAVEVPAIEKLLWRYLLTSRDARAVALPRLSSMSFATPPVTARMIAAAAAAADEFSYSALEARLSEPDRALLTSFAFADHEIEDSGQDPVAQVEACLGKLEAKGALAQRAELKARIKLAEKEGKIQEALQLFEQLSEFERALQLTMPQRSRVVE
jgi:DNA primase